MNTLIYTPPRDAVMNFSINFTFGEKLANFNELNNGYEQTEQLWRVYNPKYMYHVGTKSFGLSCEDAQDKDNWRLQIILSWKTTLKRVWERGRKVAKHGSDGTVIG